MYKRNRCETNCSLCAINGSDMVEIQYVSVKIQSVILQIQSQFYTVCLNREGAKNSGGKTADLVPVR